MSEWVRRGEKERLAWRRRYYIQPSKLYCFDKQSSFGNNFRVSNIFQYPAECLWMTYSNLKSGITFLFHIHFQQWNLLKACWSSKNVTISKVKIHNIQRNPTTVSKKLSMKLPLELGTLKFSKNLNDLKSPEEMRKWTKKNISSVHEVASGNVETT